jgi:hypothetical protein
MKEDVAFEKGNQSLFEILDANIEAKRKTQP